MSKLKYIFMVALMFLLVATVSAQEKYQIVENAGHLVLKGTSNTTDWQLKTTLLEGDAQLKMIGGELSAISRVLVDIQGKSIENKLNKRMTNKAHKALKVREHPLVTFYAYGFGEKPDGTRQIKGNISIAGKNVDLIFDFTSHTKDDIVWIVAEADAKFSDFDMEPPTDFGGAITCKDAIKIEVELPFTLPQTED